MLHKPTPEQLAGHEKLVQERKKICKRVQEAWEMKQKKAKLKELSEEKIKQHEEQERLRRWLDADLTKKKK